MKAAMSRAFGGQSVEIGLPGAVSADPIHIPAR
jgi:hypothetical protein